MSFFDIKRLLAHNKHIFRFAKQCYNLAKQAVTYPERKEKAENKLREIQSARISGNGVIWYCCVAIHPNLGDLAQTMCTLDWLYKNYPGLNVVEISSSDFYFDRDKMLAELKKFLFPTDLIVFQSGYTMTGIHEHEAMRRTIMDAFPHNRIVLLPQTIFYQTEDAKEWAISTYKDRENLLLLARDRVSYETAQNLFGCTRVALFPDIVTTLIGTRRDDTKREGILFCVRNDWERLYTKKEMATLMKRIRQHIYVSQTDTTVSIPNTEDREAVRSFIEKTIDEYSCYRLIVTDRYHGTIFSLIAGTPVIVLKTTDHKVITGAEWFIPCMANDIAVADSLEDVEKLIFQMLNQPHEYLKGAYFQERYYDHLKSLIEEDSKNVEKCRYSGGG